MNPLLKRLAVLRLKVRLLDGWQGVCALVALIVGVGLTVGILDYWAHLPNLVRAAALVTLLVGSGIVAYQYLLRPFGRSCDDLSLALRIEEAHPELNDSLASTVQFLKQSPEDEARVGGSVSMRERTVAETIAKAATCDFGRILDRRAALLFTSAACVIVVVAGAIISTNRARAGIAFMRLVEPFGQHSWTRISVARQAPVEFLEDEEKKWETVSPDPKIKDRIAIGRPYFIKVNVEGQIPKQAKLEVEGQLIRSDKLIDLKPGSDKESASFVTAIDMTQQYQKFKFRIDANDGSFPSRGNSWHEVEVVPPPKLVDLDGQPSPQIALYPPYYTDLPRPTKLVPGTRSLELMAGTQVVLRAKADRPLKEAWIEYHPENALLPPASMLAVVGQSNPLFALGAAAGGHAVWGRVPAVLDNEGSVFTISFMPWVSGSYVLHLRDFDRLDRHEASDLRVLIDPVPIVKLIQPGSSLTAHPKANVTFKFRVTDETFAIRSVFVEYFKKRPDGVGIAGTLKRTILYDAGDYGQKLPALLAQAARSPLQGKDLRLRHKQMDFEVVWSLSKEEFNDGDLVRIEVFADDFCDIYGTREPGRSHAVELRIVGRDLIHREQVRDLADIQAQLKHLQMMEEKALKTTKETGAKDKIETKDAEKFIDDDEQEQRRIQDIVGRAPDEGLRRDLAKIRQQLKDNQLADTQAYRDAGKIKGVLDSISQQELPQIEPKLADIRNELTQNEKNSPGTKKKLDETGKLQQSVAKSLDELNKDLDPSARMTEQREKLRDLLDKQTKLKTELQELNARKVTDDADKTFKEQADERRKTEIKEKTEVQKDLAQQMEKLLEEMKAAKINREENGDKDNARKLDQAIKIAEPETPKQKPMPEPKKQDPKKADPISKQMKDAAAGLKDQEHAPQKVLDQQKDIAERLEQALEALEGRNADVTKQEIQKRKDAEKKIDKLAQDLKKLRDETKKAEKIEDQEERLKKKEELARKHEKLQEDLQDLRRQLARLEEQGPANNLNEADQNLDKAKQKLQQGGNPQQEQQQAQEDLQKAKEQLQQAEEELARELLVKLADQLEALKKRQDAAVERSESLHAKVMKRKSWLEGTLGTLEGNLDAQKGIGDETDSFKDKLKEAKVFHNILERAKESMDKAGDVMKERLTNVRDSLGDEDGGKIDAAKLKEETDWQNDTLKHQKQAAKRLEILLDSIKQELAKKPRKKRAEAQAKNDDPEQPPEQKGGLQAADGIPPMAQLKALKAEQVDLNQRTEDFAKRHPDTMKLNEQQSNELRELEQEQERLQSLFQQLVTPPVGKEGEEP